MYKSNKDILIKDLKDFHKLLRRRPTRHDSNSLYQKSRKYFYSWNKMMEYAGYTVRYYQYPRIPNKLTPELSYFLGLLITDGHIVSKNQRYSILLFTSYREEKDMILKLIKNLFNYKGYLVFRKFGFNKRINMQITINSRDLVNCLNKKFNMPIGNKSLTARIPEQILLSNKNNKSNFLRGVFDGDGHISQNTMHFNSASYRFLLDIKKLLFYLGIDYKTKIQKEKTCYRINLNKKDSAKLYSLFYDKIKYFYIRKKIKLDKIFKTNIFKNMN